MTRPDGVDAGDINESLDTDKLKALMVKIEVDAAAPDVVAKEYWTRSADRIVLVRIVVAVRPDPSKMR